MSLCLALLLAAIAINWWNGWKPFTHPFQMPGHPWLKRPSTIHSKRWRSTPCPRPIVDAREPPSILLGGSRRPTNHEGVFTFDVAGDSRK